MPTLRNGEILLGSRDNQCWIQKDFLIPKNKSQGYQLSKKGLLVVDSRIIFSKNWQLRSKVRKKRCLKGDKIEGLRLLRKLARVDSLESEVQEVLEWLGVRRRPVIAVWCACSDQSMARTAVVPSYLRAFDASPHGNFVAQDPCAHHSPGRRALECLDPVELMPLSAVVHQNAHGRTGSGIFRNAVLGRKIAKV